MGWCMKYAAVSLTPGGCLADSWRFGETDVRGVLATIQVPTLVLHGMDRLDAIKDGEYLAAHIRTARCTPLAGVDLFPWGGDLDRVAREVERFLAAVRTEEADLDRVLSTVLFTDIVQSTKKMTELGDASWRQLVERHHATIRALLARYRGREIDTAGDGFFASFDGPARAVRCAQAAVDAMRSLGIEIRAGLHTGEVQAISIPCQSSQRHGAFLQRSRRRRN
jgi:Adenylate and Guanylate cyclase catalytic domain